ncbi:MAG: aspartate 1-decarboxylase [Verrucomicrobia bacterium]|nr:aspartate 1-decarboxylase [Verrucomicrobiota bacterium]MBV8377973.1 aspartate 1-decarboxylase [Verrucomicrobiota bacterium]
MYISLLKSRIHRAAVTGTDLNCEGSLSISADLAELVELEEYERILVGNIMTGEIFETYVLYAVRGQGMVTLNGVAAHRGKPGDILTILSFGSFDPAEVGTHRPKIIVLNEKNELSVKSDRI